MDITINISLTATFIYLLRPLLKFGGITNPAFPASRATRSIRRILRLRTEPLGMELCSTNRTFSKRFEVLLWRSMIGSVLIMLPTVGNVVAFYNLRGRELAWVCLTVCTLDSRLELRLIFRTR